MEMKRCRDFTQQIDPDTIHLSAASTMIVRSVATSSRTRFAPLICSDCAGFLLARPPAKASLQLSAPRLRQFSSFRGPESHPSGLLSQRDFFTPHRVSSRKITLTRWKISMASAPVVVPVSAAAEYEPNFILGTLADLLLSSPIPSYGLTIVLLTIILRSATTFPVALWQRKRMARMKSIVQPLAEEYNVAIRKELAPESRRAGLTFMQFDAKAREKVSKSCL